MLLANIHDFIAGFGRLNKSHTKLVNPQLIQGEQDRAFESYYDRIRSLALKGDTAKKLAFYGQPDQKTIDIFKKQGYSFIDLDINFHSPDHKIVPEAYCHIIRDIVNNALYFRKELEYIICTTGPDKCDQGRNCRDLLSKMNFNVIDASNINMTPIREPIISQASGPLKERVIRIMELLYNPLSEEERKYYFDNQCQPRFNYHGVPPHDIHLLDLFPEDTHIEGWIRLVEMGIPYRADLESLIHNKVPTVFFSQSFCNKQMMSDFFAKNSDGIYLDGHGYVTGSMRAKLEAFIRLRNRKKSVNHHIYKKTNGVSCVVV